MASKKNRWQSCVTVVVFCLLIFGFTAATIATPSLEFSETENRVLAGMPDVKIKTILSGDFEAAYEEYLTDQFVLRNQWISFKTSVERLSLKRESKDIYFAEDGYLIEKHTGVFSTSMARRNIAALTEFVQQYEEPFGTEHISVLIVPNAVDILQDKLPPFAESGGGNDYLEQIAENLPEDVWLDGVSVLREHQSEEIYYRTDHHWKTLAAFYAYQAWAKKQGYVIPKLEDYKIQTVTDCFEGTVQSKLGIRTEGDTIELFFPLKKHAYTVYAEDTDRTEKSLYYYTALDTKDKYAVYFGGNEPFLKIKTEVENERKILVIKDSYANCFIPFMMGEFQEIDVLDLRYTNQRLSEIIAEGGYTDILILYNAFGFAEDMSISKLTN
ncbi:DHHW family protein [Frisingicoccus sp.]|uniref:DHHW family protein n=1 Tax=Frisingicoccus sp. TaxID=1918627 RepID=UPI00399B1125